MGYNKIDYFDKFKGMKPYLTISETEWTYIKDTYEKDDIIENMTDILWSYSLPYPNVTEKTAYKDFMKLKGLWWKNLLKDGKWFARNNDAYKYSLDYDGKQIFFTTIPTGNKSSDYFHHVNRWKVDGSGGLPSPEKVWQERKRVRQVMKAAFTLKVTSLNRNVFMSLIALKFYICSTFKPSIAKAIYDMFRAENILDFSAGWGDRLAGFYASEYGKLYVGIDPNEGNHENYNRQAEFYDKHLGFFEHERTSKFICSPAEDVDYSEYENTFDLVFTSPPYFDRERYSDADTQSWVRYKNIDLWNEDFLQKTLSKLWPTIKPGGNLLVNIADVNGGKGTWLEICNPMIDFMLKTFDDAIYDGCIGMRMQKRPNCSGIGTDLEQKDEFSEIAFAEPVWVIRKAIK